MKVKFYLSLLALLSTTLWAESTIQPLVYTDALDALENPGIGFYRPVGIHLYTGGNQPKGTWGNITHLRMDISEFSDKAPIAIDKERNDTTYGKSQPITQDALEAFEATLDNVRQRGKSAIVRFAYDKNFSGYTKCDPDQSTILSHLRQLGEIYSRNTDVIQFVELGMYGSWGEMHSSHTGTNEHIAEALQTLLECTPPEIKIGVRRPDIVATWLGVNVGNNYSGFDIDSETFHQAAQTKGDTLFRVGMYNDGYLGSSSDLGTIGMGASGHQMTREMMVKWLEQYSSHTPYGGELVANYNGDHPINTPDYLSQEGFRTHTSYLNYEWHQPTILGWKEMTYEGDEAEYNGKDGFTYVENHLGYRFILRESSIETVGNKIAGRLQIENVGFGNLTKKAIVSFVICRKGKVEEIFPDETIDPQTWLSRETSTINYHLSLPDDCTEGEYKLFIRLSEMGDLAHDNNYHCIQFGNPSEQYDQSIGANLVGTLTVSDLTAMENIHNAKDTPFPVQYYNIKGERVSSASISDHQREVIIEVPTHGGEPVKKRVSVR